MVDSFRLTWIELRLRAGTTLATHLNYLPADAAKGKCKYDMTLNAPTHSSCPQGPETEKKPKITSICDERDFSVSLSKFATKIVFCLFSFMSFSTVCSFLPYTTCKFKVFGAKDSLGPALK